MATETMPDYSPPPHILFRAKGRSPPFPDKDWAFKAESHCHFGTKIKFSQTLVAPARETSEIEASL